MPADLPFAANLTQMATLMMAHDTSHHPAHGRAAPGKMTERRFLAEPTTRSNLQALVAGLGVAALGAGAYAAWMHDVPMPAAPYLFVASAVAILGAWAMGSGESAPLRVGDGGVAVERGNTQPERLPWWEVEKISLDERGRLVVESPGRRVVVARDHHAAAAASIVKEALARIPKRVAFSPQQTDALMRGLDDAAARIVEVPPVQIAGRRCKASGAIISFERDAVTCPRCGEVYDRRHVPSQCLTCDAPMPST
jgi:hypothetical protein